MNKELTVIDPATFGIEETKANELTSGLDVTIAEREVLKESYLSVIELELTPENLSTFSDLRKKFVKNRTQGFDKWKKTQKAYFLAGGNFVQAIYNKEVAINEAIESKLMEAEKHFENLEKERIEKLNAERIELLKPYYECDENLFVADMADDVWDAFLQTKKNNFQAIKDAEAKAEAERLAEIEAKRIEDERIRKENDKLKAEAETKAIRNNELRPYIQFIRKYDKMINMSESEYQKEFADIKKGASDHYEYERKEEAKRQADLAKERALKDAELEKERQAKEKVEKQLADAKAKEKAEAEEKWRIEAEEKAIAEKAAKAPIKEKMSVWINSLELDSAPVENEISIEILEKFNSFKKWADKLVKSM